MSRKTQRILFAVTACLGLLLAAGVRTFLGPCSHADGSEAMCAGAGRLLFWLGIALGLTGCAGIWARGRLRPAAAGVLLVLSAAVILAPGTLKPLCAMAEMRCNLVTRPAALVAGVLSGILSLALLIGSLRKR